MCVTGTLRKLWRRRQPISGARVPPRAPRAPHIPRAPRTCGGRPRLFWAGFTNSRAAGHGLLHCLRCLFRCSSSRGAGGAKAEPQVEVKPRWRRLRLRLGVGGPCGCPGRLSGCAQCPVRMRLFYQLLKQPVPQQIERYSRFSPSPLSIKQFLDFGECDAVGPLPRAPRECGSGHPSPPPRPACCRGSLASRQSPWEPPGRGDGGYKPGALLGLRFRVSGGGGAGPDTPTLSYVQGPSSQSELPTLTSDLLDSDRSVLKT